MQILTKVNNITHASNLIRQFKTLLEKVFCRKWLFVTIFMWADQYIYV